MDWLDLHAVQGILKSLQHHSLKASVLWHSAFFIVQLSLPYMTTRKTIAMTRWAFVAKVMSLLFNMLSWLVIAFPSRSKSLLISWLQSPSAVILEPKKIKSVSVCFPIYLSWSETGPDAMIFVFWMLSFKPAFSLLSAIRVMSSAYMRLQIFLPAILILACASSNLAFCMMYSAYKLNKQGDNIHPLNIPFPIGIVCSSMSGSNNCFLTCIQVSQEAGMIFWLVVFSFSSKNTLKFLFWFILWYMDGLNI